MRGTPGYDIFPFRGNIRIGGTDFVSLERTLTIIKPDGVEQGNIGDIIQILEHNHFKIKGAKMLHLTELEAAGFYVVHHERGFFKDLVRYVSSGPVLVMVLEAENAVMRLREIMGATDPAKAAEGTIRKQFATSIEKNVIHGSDSVENSRVETNYFFNALELF